MSDDFTRSITFEIPGAKNSPGVQVKAVEANGTLVFTVDVLATSNMTADLRGLFFNFNPSSKLAGLTYTGSHVTGFDTGKAIDLGHGANMKGAASPFDVGLEFGTQGIGHDDIRSTTFTLANSSFALTLDDIANVQFGARLTSIGAEGGERNGSSKTVVTAPAAPDAVNDMYTIFEDGQQGLDSPSSTPTGQTFAVLANDTDADGDTLTITAVKGAEHGTVQIVDGADADTLPGDAILYTPYEDYSGTDSFMYSISDNHGGTDFATANVGITAVADVPDLTYEVLAGPLANQLLVKVTATQTDADSSEYIDSIALSGMPDGVQVDATIYDPADQPDQIVKDFLITLPTGQDTDFNLGITAVSREVANGDTESATVNVPISLDYTANEYDLTFQAENQSIWSTGAEATFTDDRFIGIDTSWSEGGGGILYGSTYGHLKAGFQSTLELTAGGIDASIPYDISIETNYNKTTDVLQISSDAAISSGTLFSTTGPGGSYQLDFIFDFLANARAGIDIGLGEWDIIDLTLGPWNYNYNILDVDSSDLSYEVPLDLGFSLDFAWPDISTTSDPSATNVFTSEGESNNFLQLNLDVDDLLVDVMAMIAGVPELPNPFDINYDLLVTWGNIQLADLDLWAGLNFTQDFTMTADGLPGIITYEDGTSSAFTFGQDIVLTDASGYDQNGNGQIDFSVALDPEVLLNNDTNLGLNLGYLFKVLEVNGAYDVVVDWGNYHWGPAYSTGDDVTIPLIGVYDESFALDFAGQNVSFAA